MKAAAQLLRLVRSQFWQYCVGFIALLAGTTTVLFIPPLLGRMLNACQALADGRNAPEAWRIVLQIAGLVAIDAVATMIYVSVVALAAERISNQLRERFFKHLISVALDERPSKQLGQVASEFLSDLGILQDGYSSTLLNFIRYALFTLGGLAALLYIDLKLTIVAFAGISLFAGLIFVFIRQANKSMLSIQQYRAGMMSLLLEGAANAYIVQAYGRIYYLARRFRDSLGQTFRRVRVFILLTACISPVSLLLFSMVVAGVMMYGMAELKNDAISLKDLVSYFSYAVVLIMSGSQVGFLGARLRQSTLMLSKHESMLADITLTDPDAARQKRTERAMPIGFEFADVTFQYPDKEEPALSNVRFTVPAGMATAIVGESGAGKSTVATLLCGVYRPKRGRVTALEKSDGVLARSREDLWDQVALVPQEPFLFAGTVYENIAFGRSDVTRGRAQQAARAARIHDFISTLPEGYDTVLQEGCKNLSRGQRQRLSIARALAGNPSVIVLDEATASLDVVSEQAIKRVVDELRGRVTVIVIAHQGALLTDVDHMVVLKQGRVAFEGHPDDALHWTSAREDDEPEFSHAIAAIAGKRPQ